MKTLTTQQQTDIQEFMLLIASGVEVDEQTKLEAEKWSKELTPKRPRRIVKETVDSTV